MFSRITLIATALSLMLSGSIVSAYNNNCEGSSNSPSITDCQAAENNINTGTTYSDGAQFSVGTCYVVYATNGAGSQPLSGQTIKDTVADILADCGHHKGSFGTNNCDSCHVTVNYRSS